MNKFESGIIQTPYGKVPSNHVIEVAPNERIGVLENGHLASLDEDTGTIVRDFGEVSTDALKETDPFAYARKLTAQEAKLSESKTSNNFPGYTVEAPASNILSFRTTWKVPEKPKDPRSSVTFFIWNGLSRGALQPVLQWGNGSAQYKIANWAFVGGNYTHGKYLPVDVGTVLTGSITYEKLDPLGWHYTESFLGFPEADLKVVRRTEANGVIECFESYTTDLNEIPASQDVAMRHINLLPRSGTAPAKFDWKVVGGTPLSTPSGKNTVIVSYSTSNGEIDFYFH